MPKQFLFLFIIFCLFPQVRGQSDSLRMPLDIPLYLSGTFGELRSNHFHSGIDIKTNNEEGLPVYAIEDGFVYRIKISRGGYGKALYIQHSSGLTSVYGHLKFFNDKIETYIKQKQYKKQQYEIEVFPYKIELPVKKGEIIAYTGNTGRSSGPHLHFEIRNSLEHPLNPMQFGVKVTDTQKPVVKNVYLYPLDNNSQVNKFAQRVKLGLKRLNDSLYLTDTVVASGRIAVGIEAYDRQDFVKNHNGLYKIAMKVNGLPVFEQVMDEFSFAHSKMLNTTIDYPYYLKYHKRIQLLWVKPYNLLEIYTQLVNDGSINILPKRNYQIDIILSDFENNKTQIKIPIKGEKLTVQTKSKIIKTPYHIVPKKTSYFEVKPWRVKFLPNTLYEDAFIKLEATPNYLHIAKLYQPLQKAYHISYPLKKIKPNLVNYAYIALLGNNNRAYYISSKKTKDSLHGSTRRFGYFTIRYDSIAPYIKALNFNAKADLSNYRFLKLRIGDKKSGIKSYQAYIDGQWVLMEYDYKKGTLTYDFSDIKLEGNRHNLLVLVTDRLGNTRQYRTTFYRKK